MRAVVRCEVEVAAPAGAVWDYLTDWPRQGEWIPLTRVETMPPGAPANHIGGRIRAWTGAGPVGFWDPMTITAWTEEPDGSARCEVLHTGRVIRGEGQFAATSRGPESSRFVWSERIEVPGGPVGALLWRLLGPATTLGGEIVLRRLARRVEEIHAGRR